MGDIINHSIYVPHNLQIALRKLKIYRIRANLQIGTQSADCEILIAQSADCAIIIVQTVEPQIPP